MYIIRITKKGAGEMDLKERLLGYIEMLESDIENETRRAVAEILGNIKDDLQDLID